MNLGKASSLWHRRPFGSGLAATEAGIGVANGALGIGQALAGRVRDARLAQLRGAPSGLDDTVARANRFAKLADD